MAECRESGPEATVQALGIDNLKNRGKNVIGHFIGSVWFVCAIRFIEN